MDYRGPVRVIADERDLGEVQVHLTTEVDDRVASGWGGRVINSDYLLWGMAGRRVTLRLPDGRQVQCAVHASGRLIGLGDGPFPATD